MKSQVKKAKKRKKLITKIIDWLMGHYNVFVEKQKRTLRIERERCELRSMTYLDMAHIKTLEARAAEDAIQELEEI